MAEVAADRLFVCIGGTPNTAWAEGTSTARDARGFLLTGGDLTPEDLPDRPLARPPLHLETSHPGVFAAGDVRANSIKRVASAVGEGAMAIALTHRYLAETYGEESHPGRPVVSARRRPGSATRHHRSRRDGGGQHE